MLNLSKKFKIMTEEKFTIIRPDNKKIVGIIAGLEKGKQKPALILLHGFTGYKEQKHVEYPAKRIAEKYFITIRFDGTNGLGESGGDIFNCNTADYLKDLEQVYNFIRSVKEIDSHNIHLFGTSWGGMIAFNFKYKNSMKSIILHEPSFRWQIDNKKRIDEGWENHGYVIKHSRSKNIDVKIGYSFYKEGLNYDNPKAVSQIKVPVLLIQGQNSGDNNREESITELIGYLNAPYELEYLADTPHSGFNDEQAERLSRVILNWIEKESNG